MIQQLQCVCDQFCLPDGARDIRPYGNGHINDTYLVTTSSRRFILQRLNRFVFKRPDQVMRNIELVTAHLQKKIAQAGGDPERDTLTLVRTREGHSHFVDERGDFYRVYLFVERTVSFDLPDTPLLFERSAISFGRFQCQLADFPAHELSETIADFHNTPARFAQLQQAARGDAAGRLAGTGAEIEFAARYEREVHSLTGANLPLRVTHNDTKLNNVLMDETTGEGVCVIDLDTVMPGLAAYDFGDSIRFGGSTAAEDEQDLGKVRLNLPMYEAFVRGYLAAAGQALTQDEIRLLPMGAKLMTLECGLRFLADHLNGDVYFKVHRENHNLIRCRNQFALVRSMERNWDFMRAIVEREARAIQ